MGITELVQSSGWKSFTSKLYGFGASIVIVGALFKIQHWPFAGAALTAGLLIEAVIFFFSAFDPDKLFHHFHILPFTIIQVLV